MMDKIWILALSSLAFGFAWGTVSDQLHSFLNNRHARLVWTQQLDSIHGDADSRQGYDVLMGLDTRTDTAGQVILGEASSYVQPLITSDGQRIVYTKHVYGSKCMTCAVQWDGTQQREITEGAACDVWQDPITPIEWVYVNKIESPDSGVWRYQLLDPSKKELVWNQNSITRFFLKVSKYGRLLVGLNEWPTVSLIHWQEGKDQSFSIGCFPSFSPDSRNVIAHFIHHTSLVMHDSTGRQLGLADVTTAPGVSIVADGEMGQAQWSNWGNFFVIGGPYVFDNPSEYWRVGLFVGEFDETFTGVRKWLKITNNHVHDKFGDLWVEGAWPGITLPRQTREWSRFGKQGKGTTAHYTFNALGQRVIGLESVNKVITIFEFDNHNGGAKRMVILPPPYKKNLK